MKIAKTVKNDVIKIIKEMDMYVFLISISTYLKIYEKKFRNIPKILKYESEFLSKKKHKAPQTLYSRGFTNGGG